MTKMYHSGVDVFSSDPDQPPKNDIYCLACKTNLKGEKRLRYGSWASAMAKRVSWAYDYHCPHTGKPAHDRLVALVQERDDLTSNKLRSLVEAEIEEERALFKAQNDSL